MSFAFNFPSPDESVVTDVENQLNNDKVKDSDGDIEAVEPFKEIEILSGADYKWQDLNSQTYQLSEDVCIQCIDSQDVERRLCDQQGSLSSVAKAAQQHSDLIPNVYEGGLKLWECAVDLIEYLHSSDTDFKKKKVLELGCGAGLPGILAIQGGADSVHFQDYNPEVIENYTIPNVMLNMRDKYTCTCRYMSGDWAKFNDEMVKENIRYDLILTAETIYKPDNYKKLTAIFETFLSNDGVVFVAAKSNYFGVGGGTRDFENFVNSQKKFDVNTCKLIESGVPREILQLTWKS